MSTIKPKSLKGRGISTGSLKNFLLGSYSKTKNQKQNIDGYHVMILSQDNALLSIITDTGHAIVTHKGTQSIQDWTMSAMSTIGLVHKTKRYKHGTCTENSA